MFTNINFQSEYIKKEEDCFEDENLRSVLVDYDDSDGMQRFSNKYKFNNLYFF